MRKPSLRLTNSGNGPETVTVFTSTYSRDVNYNYVRKDVVKRVYPAIVTRSISAENSTINKMQSTTIYTVMLCECFADPEICINQFLIFADNNGFYPVQAQGAAILSMTGAYQFNAVGVDPMPSQTLTQAINKIPTKGNASVNP